LNSKNQQLTKHFPIFVLYENNLLLTVWNSNYTFLKRISWMTQEENQEDPWLHAARR